MAKTTSTSKTTTATKNVTPVKTETSVKTVTPVKTETSEKSVTKKVVKKADVIVAPIEIAPIELTEPVVDEVLASASIKDRFVSFSSMIQQLSSNITALRTELKIIERDTTRDMKVLEKANAKRKKKSGNRKPSGFVKPTLISTELANFLGKPDGTEMARTEVTREINAYIKSNKLQDVTNGRRIIPDTKLKTLLKINKGDELTYFNLQKYMSSHFAKANKEVEASV